MQLLKILKNAVFTATTNHYVRVLQEQKYPQAQIHKNTSIKRKELLLFSLTKRHKTSELVQLNYSFWFIHGADSLN